jgi:hypothetical protein
MALANTTTGTHSISKLRLEQVEAQAVVLF